MKSNCAFPHLGSQIDYLNKRKWEFAYQDRYPEIKEIADALREKKGRKGLKALAAEIGCVRPFEVDRFLKGASLQSHQIEAVKKWLLLLDSSKPNCPFCGATILDLMIDCVVCHK